MRLPVSSRYAVWIAAFPLLAMAVAMMVFAIGHSSDTTEAATDGAAMSLRVDASQTTDCLGGPQVSTGMSPKQRLVRRGPLERRVETLEFLNFFIDVELVPFPRKAGRSLGRQSRPETVPRLEHQPAGREPHIGLGRPSPPYMGWAERMGV